MKIIYMKNKKEKWVSNVPKVPREEKRQWMNIEKWWDLYKVRHGLFWGRSVWRWAVVQYEQYPSDPDPVVVQCKYFEGKDGAEEYLKLKKSQEGEINNDE